MLNRKFMTLAFASVLALGAFSVTPAYAHCGKCGAHTEKPCCAKKDCKGKCMKKDGDKWKKDAGKTCSKKSAMSSDHHNNNNRYND